MFHYYLPTKASRVKNIFPQSFRAWSSAVSYFRAYFEGKKKKIDPSNESVQSVDFLTWAKLEPILSQKFSKKASYHSKTSQNDLITICRQFITEFVV